MTAAAHRSSSAMMRTHAVAFAVARHAAILGLTLAIGGCAQLTYDQVKLGQTPREYEKLLPAEQSRKTPLGLCYYRPDHFGSTDAIIVLLSHDRRVAGKVRATLYERDFGFRVDRGFSLAGELNPRLAEMAETPPTDMLRAITSDIASFRGERLALDAHQLVAAGLVRLLERWPEVNVTDLGGPQLQEALERVPSGGTSATSTDDRGDFHFEYRQGVVR